MGAEMTATMVVWPKQCGHGGTVLELVEHHRPYWLGRRAGRRVSAPVPARGYTLSTGLALSRPAAAAAAMEAGLADWAGRRVTVLRYAGCFLGDAEVEAARAAGVQIEVFDIDGDSRAERSA